MHRGCIPTRAMLEAAGIADAVTTRGPRWGIEAVLEKVALSRLIGTRDDIVQRNYRAVRHHLDHAGVQLFEGWGRLTDARSVEVNGMAVVAKRAVVVATGSEPRRFDRIEPDGSIVLTSDGALGLGDTPGSAVILGGGAIGVEFAQIWGAFGADVTILEREERLAPFEDAAVGATLSRALARRGIRSVTGIRVENVETSPEGVTVRVTRNGRSESHRAEVLLLAAGRSPATGSIGLEDVGVDLPGGYVSTDGSLETRVPGVYAVGDVLAPPSIGRANAAFAEGMVAADAIAGLSPSPLDYTQMPRVTHGIIETACVGLSEEAASSAGLEPRSMALPGSAVPKGAILGEPGMTKVVLDGDDLVVGIHLVGPNATEIIGEATALTNFQASAQEAATLVHPHPALSESLHELHLALSGRPLHLR